MPVFPTFRFLGAYYVVLDSKPRVVSPASALIIETWLSTQPSLFFFSDHCIAVLPRT